MTNPTTRRSLSRREYCSTALNSCGQYDKRDRFMRWGILPQYNTIQCERPWRAHAVAFRYFPLLLKHCEVSPSHPVLRKRIPRVVR